MDFIFEITKSLCTFGTIIKDFLTDIFIPHVKLALLFPFAFVGSVRFQLMYAEVLYINHYSLNLKNPQKWLTKGLVHNNPKAYILKAHFDCIEAHKIEDQETETDKKLKALLSGDAPVIISKEIREYERINSIEEEEKIKLIKPLLEQSLEYYKRACEMGNPAGYFYIYRMQREYKYHLGIKGSFSKYLIKAANMGCADAQMLLAQKLLQKDEIKQGLDWIKKASSSKRSFWLKDEYSFGSKKEALKWLRKNRHWKKTGNSTTDCLIILPLNKNPVPFGQRARRSLCLLCFQSIPCGKAYGRQRSL